MLCTVIPDFQPVSVRVREADEATVSVVRERDGIAAQVLNALEPRGAAVDERRKHQHLPGLMVENARFIPLADQAIPWFAQIDAFEAGLRCDECDRLAARVMEPNQVSVVERQTL